MRYGPPRSRWTAILVPWWFTAAAAAASPTIELGVQGALGTPTVDQRDVRFGGSAVFRPLPRFGVELAADLVRSRGTPDRDPTPFSEKRRSQQAVLMRVTPLQGQLGWDQAGLGTVALDLDVGAGVGFVQTLRLDGLGRSLPANRVAGAWQVEPVLRMGGLGLGLGLTGRHWGEPRQGSQLASRRIATRIDAQLRASWTFGGRRP